MEGVWSTHVEIHFVSLLAWEGFGQHMLGGVFSSHVEINFVSSLVWDGFGQHML